MPIYEYKCKTCSHEFTKIIRSPEDRPTSPTCPECGAVKTRRIISVPSIAIGATGSDQVSEEIAREQARQASHQDLDEALRRGQAVRGQGRGGNGL